MAACFSCGRVLTIEGRVGRAETCPGCGSDLHCCRNCRHYDPAAYNECREPSAERVLEKERSNFCDFFEIAGRSGGSGEAERRRQEAKKKLEGLFKKP